MTESLEKGFQNKLTPFFRSQDRLQEKAWNHLWLKGIPLATQGDSRFSRLRELYGTSFQSSSPARLTKEQIASKCPQVTTHPCVVFVNGVFQENLSTLDKLPKDIRVLPFSKAMHSFGPFLKQYLTKTIQEETNPFSLLNTAIYEEGVFLYIPPTVVIKNPIYIVHWVENEQECSLFSPRFHLFAGKESSSKVIFKQVSQGKSYWINSALDFTLEEGAAVDCFQVIDEKKEAWHFEAIRVHLKKESSFKSVTITNGSHSFSQNYHLTIAGEKAEVALYGNLLLNQNRLAHINIEMNHHEPASHSLQKFKSVLNGTSRAHFQGKIFVTPKALKTQAYQMNSTLLLSEKSSATSRPMLEILADDVKASHGATVGQFNSDELFYLKSRGLSEKEGRRLLLLGFAKDIIDLIPYPSLVTEAIALAERTME